MTRRIALIGAGPLGLNVAGIVRKLPEFELAGFIDSGPSPVGDVPLLGDDDVLDDIRRSGTSCLVVCIGDTDRRLAKAAELRQRGFELPAIIHPSADLGVNVRVGDGCIIFPGAIVLPETTIGELSIIEAGVFVGHHSELAPGTLLGARATVGNKVTLEGGCRVGMGVAVASGSRLPMRTRVADFGVWRDEA
jgi:hypothetical protein